MTTLSEVEAGVAEVGHERRRTARLTAAGIVVFVGVEAARHYAKADGSGATRVLPFKVYAGQRAALISCEASAADVVDFVLRLVDGELIRIAGQLVATRGRFNGAVRLRVTSAERAALREEPVPMAS